MILRVYFSDVLGNYGHVIVQASDEAKAKEIAEKKIRDLGQEHNYHWETDRKYTDLTDDPVIDTEIYDHEMGGDPRS
jgi:hypothetical protein